MEYIVLADVSIDIDGKFAKEKDIRYVPMEYILGEQSYCCEAPETEAMMHTYYEKLRQKVTTHTSQIVPANYMEAFEPYVKEGKGILYLSLSSGLSNTYESALMAVEMLKEEYGQVEIEVVDSLGATGGMGLLAESAVCNKEQGMSLEDNARWLRERARHIHYWFKVEDLMYLKRGGRISAATALIGTALNIKPILKVDARGKLETIDKKRGNKPALKALISNFEEMYDDSLGKLVYICHADCTQAAETLKSMLLEKYPNLVVRMTMLSPIIGAHTGPDMVALIHYGAYKGQEK